MEPKKCLSSYRHFDKALRQVQQVLATYRGLSCKKGPFVFNDGKTLELAHLDGTIPVQFKGAGYNIPICIWLMQTHPEHPPICYVKPTSDMQIKMSMYVDHSGKIYLPYLHDWSRTMDADLIGLIQVMIMTFGEHPPVFSKPKNPEVTAVPYPQQVYMPMPGAGMPAIPMPSGGGYPAYPRSPAPFPQPTPYPSARYSVEPCMYPPSITQPAPTPPIPDVYNPPVSTSSGCSTNSGTITDEHIKLSLLSAIEHKVKKRLEENMGRQRAELEILEQTASELSKGKHRIQEIIDRLNNDKSELERSITLLKEKDAELERAISNAENEDHFDVDEAVTTTAPLYKQILNSYAEEAAIEDAIYYMAEALRRGVIDLDVFLKQVRALARRQFKLRALMAKCRQRAGLTA